MENKSYLGKQSKIQDHTYAEFKADMEKAFNESIGIKVTPLNIIDYKQPTLTDEECKKMGIDRDLHERPQNKSCTKVKFATEADALYYINKLKTTSSREKKPIDTYLCHFCSCWHLTSRPNYDTKDKNTIKALKTELKNKNLLIAQLNLKINQLKKKGKN